MTATLRGPRHPRWRGDAVGYRGAHLRVVRERGRADRYRCIECGQRATGWSLAPDADLRALTSAWMGHSSFEDEIAREAIVMVGDRTLARSMPKWLRQSSFAASGQGRLSEPDLRTLEAPSRTV